jgi:hypothetical protein
MMGNAPGWCKYVSDTALAGCRCGQNSKVCTPITNFGERLDYKHWSLRAKRTLISMASTLRQRFVTSTEFTAVIELEAINELLNSKPTRQ